MIIRISKEILHCVEIISAHLSRIISQLELSDVPARPDLKIAAKDFVCDFLTQTYGWVPAADLPDMPLVDLTDKTHTTAVYVTTDISSQNIRSLLADFKDYPGRSRFSKLIILVVTNREIPVSLKQINQHPHYLGSNDLWNIPRLIQNLENLKLEQLEQIIEYLNHVPGSPWISKYTPTFRLPQIPDCTSYIAGSRVRELEMLRKTLWNGEPVFLWGAAGMGKTMLASYAAGLYTPPQGSYYLRYQVPLDDSAESMRETILYADLAGYRFRGEDNEQHDQEYRERLEILRRDYQNALLIIDEFDHPSKALEELQAEASYRDLLATGIRLIFTTRANVREHGIKIGGLSQYILQQVTANSHFLLIKCISRADCTQTEHTLQLQILLKEIIEKQALSVSENADMTTLAIPTLQFVCILAEEGFDYSFLTKHLTDESLRIFHILHRMGLFSLSGGILQVPRMVREFSLLQKSSCIPFLDNLWNSFALHPHDPILLRRIARCFCHASNTLPDPNGNNAQRAGRLLELIGQHTTALRYTMRAVELRENQLPGDHPDLASVYSDAGQLFSILNMHEKALEYHEGALDILLENLDPHHPDLAVAHSRVADARKALRQQSSKTLCYI